MAGPPVCSAQSRVDPYQAFHVGTAVDLRRAPYLSASKGQGNP
jgi:hypothetical protein